MSWDHSQERQYQKLLATREQLFQQREKAVEALDLAINRCTTRDDGFSRDLAIQNAAALRDALSPFDTTQPEYARAAA